MVRPRRALVLAAVALALAGPSPALAGEPPPPADPGAAAGDASRADETVAGAAPDDATTASDAPTTVVAASDEPDVVVTALRHEADPFDVPYFSTVIPKEELRTGPENRSLANAVAREPGVMVQKTGPGQSSPFIRGFTGFRTLLMVDGIRLNNSTFRSGPNQYFSTVDLYAIDRLELTRGPTSVLYGSDAIGGALNAITGPADAADGEWHGGYTTRYSTGEHAWFHRLEVEGGEPGDWAVRLGVTDKNFGDIRAGDDSDELDGTAYDERDVDLRVDKVLDEDLDLTFVYQRVNQNDVPRTHKTIDAVPFAGTTIGDELSRELSQTRDLAYARLRFERAGFVDRGAFTLSYQRQQETQDRVQTGGRFDTRGFDLRTIGAQLELQTDVSHGTLTYGFDAFHDEVDSFRREFEDGMLVSDNIQGNLADDAEYDLFGLFVQDEIRHESGTTTVGLRYERAEAEADAIDNPNVPGSDPTTPGNVLTLDESWNALVGSVRHVHELSADSNVYVGLSQGFRAPNLSDLTSDLEDSGIETPTPDLDPEHFLAFEVGAKTRGPKHEAEVAVFSTWMRDTIVRSPTGEFVEGVAVLQKDNVGDGAIWGVEARLEREVCPGWTAFGSVAWMDGRVDQFLESGEKIDKPVSRLMPLTGLLGVTWEPEDRPYWAQADLLMADEADRLSLRDETDTTRIPPGGTPGYGVLGVRGGMRLDERTTLTLALENVLDKDYRIHGSGQNEPGRNLVATLDVRF